MRTPAQTLIISTVLPVLEKYGFALAGGQAVIDHGIINRPTEDIDIFTANLDEDNFQSAIDSVHEALYEAGISVTSFTKLSPLFCRFIVETKNNDSEIIELGFDWRKNEATISSNGNLVISKEDSAANKLLALWGRSEARDFIDTYAWINFGGISKTEIIELAKIHDEGFTVQTLKQAIGKINDHPDVKFEQYLPNEITLKELKSFFDTWKKELDTLQIGLHQQTIQINDSVL